jgi:sec-independent protein translocase protein TatA
MYPQVVTFVGLPGGPELLVILLLVVLLFGADRLPKLARSSGQAMGEFRKGRDAVEAEIRAAREETLAEGGNGDDAGDSAAEHATEPAEAVTEEPDSPIARPG